MILNAHFTLASMVPSILLVFAACEAALGLSLLVLVSNTAASCAPTPHLDRPLGPLPNSNPQWYPKGPGEPASCLGQGLGIPPQTSHPLNCCCCLGLCTGLASPDLQPGAGWSARPTVNLFPGSHTQADLTDLCPDLAWAQPGSQCQPLTNFQTWVPWAQPTGISPGLLVARLAGLGRGTESWHWLLPAGPSQHFVSQGLWRFTLGL